MLLFFKDLDDAVECLQFMDHAKYVVIDGPEDNFALVDRYTASELQDCELADVIDLRTKVSK